MKKTVFAVKWEAPCMDVLIVQLLKTIFKSGQIKCGLNERYFVSLCLFPVFYFKAEYVSKWVPSSLIIPTPSHRSCPSHAEPEIHPAVPLWAHRVPVLLTGVPWPHITHITKPKFLCMVLEDLLQLNSKFASQERTSSAFLQETYSPSSQTLCPVLYTQFTGTWNSHGPVRSWASSKASA